MEDQNTAAQKSPFAPVDLPDLNAVAAGAAMPPMMDLSGKGMMPAEDPMAMAGGTGMAMPDVTMASIPEPKIMPETPAVPQQAIPQPTTSQPSSAAPANGASVATPGTSAAKPTMPAAKAPVAAATSTSSPQVAAVNQTKKTDAAPKKPEAKVEIPVAMAVPGIKEMIKDVTSPDVERARKAEKAPLSDEVVIEALLEECIRHNASDLHLQVNLPPVLRVNGTLLPMATYPVLTNEMVRELVFATLDEDQQKILIKDKEFDYSFAFGDLGRFRVNAFHEKGNMAAAFRLIPNAIKTIDELGLPGVVETFADHPNGLVLVTGPTGSGKTTTLAALIDKINTERPVHIITIEDPIEFTHQSKRAVVAQREVHYDTYSFAAALRSILREDPDVVLIGEMRDLETMQAAITVAETGHLVFATLHTNSAAQSIDRMIDVFPAHQQPQIRSQLANILVGVCSQRLIPAIEGGRIAVAEILVSNSAVRSIIREGKTHQLDSVIQTGLEQGMQTMDRELAKLVKAGVISLDVAREYTVDTAEFDRLVRG